MKNHCGIYLCDNKYYYCSDTNTLLNAELAELYKENSDERKINITDISVDIDSVRDNLKKVKQIIFEGTQKCNLQCAYCTYESGEYKYSRQPGSSKSLTFDTAKRSINHIWDIIKDRDNKELTIGFYGGEPLLNFGTIKKIVSYAKELLRGWSIKFTMTTNGTLLNRQTIDYIINENFLIHVSLDGPQQSHDSKRTFKNSKGSYHKVMENLSLLKSVDEKYYRDQVYFSVVYSKDLPFENLFHFFRNEELVNRNETKLGYVTSTDTSYYDKYPFDKELFDKSKERIFDSIKSKENEGKELLPIERAFCSQQHILKESLLRREFTTLMGTCFYDSRLYVDAVGGFHICEKINPRFQFGNAYDGFDFHKMVDITTQYVQLLKENCAQCEVRFICNKCYIHFAKDGSFQVSDEYCKKERLAIKKMLENTIYLQEKI